MPNRNMVPHLAIEQRVYNLYYLLPPGGCTRGDYTPQIFISRECSVKTLISIIKNSLPSLPTPHAIEVFYNLQERPVGWYLTSWGSTSPTLLDKYLEYDMTSNWGHSFVVSVRVLDVTAGCMVPFDPFPTPASPPKVLTWTPACVQ